MPINIHGKQYNTVAERIVAAGNHLVGVETEVLQHDPVVIKATITVTRDEQLTNGNGRLLFHFTGISAANASKSIEKESPYEVAETSAVGRALAFAGYETTNGIASAEEMAKIASPQPLKQTNVSKPTNVSGEVCATCGEATTYKEGLTKAGKKWGGYFCANKDHAPKWVSVKQDLPDKVVEDEVIQDLPF